MSRFTIHRCKDFARLLLLETGEILQEKPIQSVQADLFHDGLQYATDFPVPLPFAIDMLTFNQLDERVEPPARGQLFGEEG